MIGTSTRHDVMLARRKTLVEWRTVSEMEQVVLGIDLNHVVKAPHFVQAELDAYPHRKGRIGFRTKPQDPNLRRKGHHSHWAENPIRVGMNVRHNTIPEDKILLPGQ